MFYHIDIAVGDITSYLHDNKTREEVLFQYICPFLNREISMFEGRISNLMFLIAKGIKNKCREVST